MERVRVGLIGSGFITAIHYEALSRVAGAEVIAVASPTQGHAERFAAEREIPRHFTDYRALLDLQEIDLVVLGLPNDLHCEATCLAAEAGKHVVVEKPMAPSLAECDRMIEACERAGVMLGYAEELCFAPKYVRLKHLVRRRSAWVGSTSSSSPRNTTGRTQAGSSIPGAAAAASRSTWAAMPSSSSDGSSATPPQVPRPESREPSPRWARSCIGTRRTATMRRSWS